MYNELVTLIDETDSNNSIGDPITIQGRKDVLVDMRTVGMKEAYEAMSVGLKPEYNFVLPDYLDYDGQELIEYEGVQYKVLRTFRKKPSDELEIIVTR